jgi:flagellar biosynthesis protein FlhB
MAEADSNQKTEQPSQRKLQHARSQGQVVQSREINSWIMLATGSALVLLLGPSLTRSLQHNLARFLDPTSLLAADGVRWEAVRQLIGEIGSAFILPAVAVVAAALAGSLIQNGLVLAFDKIGFDFSHLSPIKGFTRLLSLRSAAEFFKSIIKVAGITAVIVWMLAPEIDRLPLLPALTAMALPGELHRQLQRLALGVLVALAAAAILDYGYQRIVFMQGMRMSRQEVKEEHKQSEGDPVVKARLRQVRMERARRRMMAAVPGASVVITNPTHYAIALKYAVGDQGAPKLVAKGADLIAQRIRDIARENDVPVVENPALARSLYASVDLDQEIPPEHYRAVAEIINYVFRLKARVRPA